MANPGQFRLVGHEAIRSTAPAGSSAPSHATHSLGLFLKSEEERIQNAIDAHDAAQSASEALVDSQENLEELQEQMASSERSDDEDLENQIAASKRSIQKNRKQLGEAAADLRQYGIRFVPDRRDLKVDGLELGDTR